MKVLIVGAGLGGLALGGFLKKFGINFDIVDKVTDWGEQGYAIGMWDNGRDMLRRLGLEEKFDLEGERIKEFQICRGNGKLLRQYNLKDFYTSYGSAYTHVTRKTIHDWLIELVGEERIILSTTVKSLKQNATSVIVELSNGAEKEYDVVVGADGIHSSIRGLVFGNSDFEKYSEWRAWIFWIDDKFRKDKTVINFIEHGLFVSIVDHKEKALCIMMAPAPYGSWDEEQGRIDRLKKTFQKFDLINQIFEGRTDKDVMPTNVSFVDMKNWIKGRVVLLGDSAHALEPFAGLGASMALEDAYVLSSELMQVKDHKKDLSIALRNYQNKRQTRLKWARKETKYMRLWAIPRSGLIQKIISMLMPYGPVEFFTQGFHKLLKQEI